MTKTKKGPLSNKEKEYIQNNLKSIEADVEAVAQSMNRSVATINKYIDKMPKPSSQKTESSSAVKPGDLLARKEDRGVTIMTESASMAADESKKKRSSNQNPERYTQYIHKIK